MSKEKSIAAPSFLHELVHFGVYKRSQGRITRQVTFAVIFIATALAAWRLGVAMEAYGWGGWAQYAVPLVLVVLGFVVAFRAVNYPRFADFLIAVEAEMNKVSWPSKTELIRSSAVVIFVIFFLSAILFIYDFVWTVFFETIGVIQ